MYNIAWHERLLYKLKELGIRGRVLEWVKSFQEDDGTAVVFTDGSCLGNPGPYGAGACIFPQGASEPVMLKQPVSSTGPILLGQKETIKSVLHYISLCKVQKNSPFPRIHNFSDSQSAFEQLTLY